MESAGILNLEGRHPVSVNEISLAWGTKTRLGANVGDEFLLILEGISNKYKITGFYQSVNNMGEGFRLRGEALELLNPTIKPMSFLVVLKDGVDKTNFINKYKKEYSSSISLTSSEENYAMISGSTEIIFQSMFVLLFILGVIISIVINNDMYTSISQHSRFFGILKTQGYTPLQLQLILIVRNIIVTLIAVPIGIIVGGYITPILTSAITKSMGLVKFPVVFDIFGTFLFVVGLIVFMAISSFFMSFRVRYISTRKLIRE